MNKREFKNKKTQRARKSEKIMRTLNLPSKLITSKQVIKADVTHTLWLESGTSIYTFNQGSTTYYLNLAQELIANSSALSRYQVSTPQNDTTYIFEYARIKAVTIKFVPLGLNKSVQPALVGFSFRVFPSEPSLRYLPNSIQGKYIPTTFDLLISQTNKPQSKTFQFDSTVLTNRTDLFKYYSGYDFYNLGYFGNICGIVMLNQTTPCDTADIRYKIGYIEMSYVIEIVNPIY